MTLKTSTDKFEAIWWSYSCKLLSCLLVTRLHQNWHKNSMTDSLETKLPKASSSFLWSLYGLFSRFWASFLVYLLFQKCAKPMKRLCNNWNFLSTNPKPSSMRRTSRSWTWCSASHSSRWFSSRLTNQFREISIRYSKEWREALKRSWSGQTTKRKTWRKTMTSRGKLWLISRNNKLSRWTISRENTSIEDE